LILKGGEEAKEPHLVCGGETSEPLRRCEGPVIEVSGSRKKSAGRGRGRGRWGESGRRRARQRRGRCRVGLGLGFRA
jgi:hypothetical protein